MRLVVNIPTYNEKENIEEIINKVLDQNKKIPQVDLHVLFFGNQLFTAVSFTSFTERKNKFMDERKNNKNNVSEVKK